MESDDLQGAGSVTMLLEKVKNGLDPAAAQQLFERYFRQLEWVARGKMAGLKRSVKDEEDLAVTALGQFFQGIRNGRFPRLDDRHDLWQVLLVVLDRRVVDERRRQQGKKELGESAIGVPESDDGPRRGMNELPGSAATPEALVILREQLDLLLQRVPKEKWRQVALWKLEQRTNAEIAQRLDCTVRQVERILSDIRQCLEPTLETPGRVFRPADE
jgi:RNA polymerase sigma factor (sigma-70 family)